MNDKTDFKTQKSVDLSHPLAVTLSEVVVDGDDMNAVARQCVQICGKRCNERLSFARFHLGDPALVQNDTADELAVEMSHSENPARRLANGRERLGQNVVERFAVGKPFLEYIRLFAQFRVGKSLERGFKGIDLRNGRRDLFQFA